MKEKITFLEDVEVEDHNGDVVFEAKAGDTVELVAPSAARWVRRKKAEYTTDEKPKKKAAPKKKKAESVKDDSDADK